MTGLRIISSSDLGARVVPLSASFGEYGTCTGIQSMVEASQTPAIWFDDGLGALHEAVPRLRFPLLCANADAGLPATTVVDTEAGPVGAIGLTHPQIHRSSQGPRPADDRRFGELAHALVRPWAADVDLILGGHNFGAWAGTLAGTPAGQPYLFASSVVVVDLGERVVVRRVERVPPVRPRHTSAAVAAIDAAAADVVGESAHTWLSRTAAERYLPDLLAQALRDATGADAALVPSRMHGIQPPIDGAVGALRAGPVTRLDLARLLPSPEYDPIVVELRPGELARAVAAHDRAADPANREPHTLAVVPFATRMLGEWLGRAVAGDPAGGSAHAALLEAAR